jgi:hypothetical protein
MKTFMMTRPDGTKVIAYVDNKGITWYRHEALLSSDDDTFRFTVSTYNGVPIYPDRIFNNATDHWLLR